MSKTFLQRDRVPDHTALYNAKSDSNFRATVQLLMLFVSKSSLIIMAIKIIIYCGRDTAAHMIDHLKS